MAIVYATLIVKGKKTIGDVPEGLKQKVIEILNDWGFIIGGDY